MKRFPVTTIPVLLTIAVALLFVFYVPKGGDLISGPGDKVLGAVIGVALVVCVLIDRKGVSKRKS